MRGSSKDEDKQSLEGVEPDSLTVEGADPSANISYRNISLREKRWARTETNGWKSVAALALVIGLCLGLFMLMIVMQRGWDGLVALLGY